MVEKVKLGILLVVSSAISAAVMWVFQGHTLQVMPDSMSYADFVALILSALSALLALLGIALAIAAIWGWAEFKSRIDSKVNELTPGLLETQLRDGEARELITNLVGQMFRIEHAKAEELERERERAANELDELDTSPPEGEQA